MIAAARPATAAETPVATVTSGQVRGEIADGIAVFKGIPYGASAAGVNRFRPPQPVQPWNGVRDALTFPSMAPQPPSPIRGLFASWSDPSTIGEDCLGLNVWTPAVHDGGKRPVMASTSVPLGNAVRRWSETYAAVGMKRQKTMG